MNAYLNQIIQTFQDSHPQRALNRLVGDLDREIGDVYRAAHEESMAAFERDLASKPRPLEWWRETVDCTPYLVDPPVYWERLEDAQDEEIRYLHEDYGTMLRECVYCERLIEAGPDWGDYCEDCYWDMGRDEGRD